MEIFTWNNNYLTGIDSVDGQHHRLVELINELGNIALEDSSAQKGLQHVLDQLVEYTHYHFTEEEQLMADSHIDERHYELHKKTHAEFLDYLSGIIDKKPSSQILESSRDILNYLTHWLMYHILGMDMFMSRQLADIAKGKSAKQAYDDNTRKIDKTTEPLVSALNGLLADISLRNKELFELNAHLEEKVEERTKELSIANTQLEKLALTDVLTGLPNRRHAMNQLALYWQEAIEHDNDLSCMMIDADHFKEVNDAHGHDAGDVVLKKLAINLAHNLRTDDFVARLGGDEFFVICNNTGLEGAIYLAEKLRSSVSQMRVRTGDGFWNSSVSIGVASKSAAMRNHDELIKAADNNVYAAKSAGKNCVRPLPDAD